MWRERLMPLAALKEELRYQPPDRWLSAAELQRLSELSSADRRLQWLGGRWLAKQVLRSLVGERGPAFSDLHIESRDGLDRPARPRVWLRGRMQPWHLTISHSANGLYVVASCEPHCSLGADVMDAVPLDPALAGFWFSDEERAWCRRIGQPWAESIIWSLKESWYKAAGARVPFAPRCLDIMHLTPIARARVTDFATQENAVWTIRGLDCWIVCRRAPGMLSTLVCLQRGVSRSAVEDRHDSIAAAVCEGWKKEERGRV
jgi:4'-phosphopantetheinyl transferase EntD